MPDITPKSPEVLQAQAAAFMAETDRVDYGQNFVTVITAPENTGLTSLGLNPSERTGGLSPDEAQYVGFLRASAKAGREAGSAAERAELTAAYEDFAPVVNPLLDEIESQDKGKRRRHPAFIGYGQDCSVFGIEHEGKDYAVRVPWKHTFSSVSIDSQYVASGLKAKGIPHLEQLAAVSYERGVTIAEMMPGRILGELPLHVLENVTDEQLKDFIETLKAAQAKGLFPELTAYNVLYDEEEGFGIVDIAASDNKKSESMDLAELIKDGIGAIHSLSGRAYKLDKEEGHTYKRSLYEMLLPLFERYRYIAGEVFAGSEGRDVDGALARKFEHVLSLAQEAMAPAASPQIGRHALRAAAL